MSQKSWRCFLCENTFQDLDMRGPFRYSDNNKEYYICYSCARDMNWGILKQPKYMLLQCPGCSRGFMPLLDFDPSQFFSKVLRCPFCNNDNTLKFRLKPEGSILKEKSPQEFLDGPEKPAGNISS